MALVNTSKPTTSLTNIARVVDYTTWDTNTTSWNTEVRTWDDMASTMGNITKVTANITNLAKP